MLTYKGKIISVNNIAQYLDDETADQVVAEGLTFNDIVDGELSVFIQLSTLRNDDGTNINVDTQLVNVHDVPGETTFVFVLEPAFYEV